MLQASFLFSILDCLQMLSGADFREGVYAGKDALPSYVSHCIVLLLPAAQKDGRLV